jgi:hypothetical protein
MTRLSRQLQKTRAPTALRREIPADDAIFASFLTTPAPPGNGTVREGACRDERARAEDAPVLS